MFILQWKLLTGRFNHMIIINWKQTKRYNFRLYEMKWLETITNICSTTRMSTTNIFIGSFPIRRQKSMLGL